MSCVRKAAIITASWLTLAVVGLRAAEAVVLEPAIELPTFEVTDSRLLPQPEAWHYAAIPGFEILSSASERATKRFTSDFLLLQQVVEAIMPGLRRTQVAVPTALILCGRGKDFDQFLPVDRTDDAFRTNSIFLQDAERAAIVVDFAVFELDLDSTTTIESDPYRGFYLQYFRALIRQNVTSKPPPWLEEGLVQLLAATEFNRKWITFAQVGNGFGGDKPGSFSTLLRRRALIPLGDMFTMERPKTREAFWAAQSYAFVHFCLYGWNASYQKALLTFVERSVTEGVSEALFEECFHRSYAAMGVELRSYLDSPAYRSKQYKAKKGKALPEPPAIEFRSATDAESGRIKGEALRLGGHGDEAHNALIAPYIRNERDPRLLAALGLDERGVGHDERGRKFLEAAVTAKVDRPRAYLELARLRHADVLRSTGSLSGWTPEQVSSVIDPLLAARKQPPPMSEVYELAADTWANVAATPTHEQLDLLIEGARFFPRRLGLLYQTAVLCLRAAEFEHAASLINYGVARASSAEDEARFEALKSSLPAAVPTPTPAAEPPPVKSPSS